MKSLNFTFIEVRMKSRLIKNRYQKRDSRLAFSQFHKLKLYKDLIFYLISERLSTDHIFLLFGEVLGKIAKDMPYYHLNIRCSFKQEPFPA